MPCFHQQLAVPMPGKTRNGKTPYKFIGKAKSYYTRYQSVVGLKLMPCRQCIGCRLERSRQWATRLLLEAPHHDNACFLTLTYDDDHLPKNRSLNKDHLSVFFDKLRSRCDYYGKGKIKYFRAGEYATPNAQTPTGRPHYHAIVYGPYGVYDNDPSRTETERTRSGGRQFLNDDFAACWPHGLHGFSEFNFETAAYVARYILKKVSGKDAPDHYGTRVPEFQSGSNGLGESHLRQWISDVYPADHVVLPGRGAFLPPPYFDRLLEKVDPTLFQKVKEARQESQDPITTALDFQEHVSELDREGQVRQLVTDATLIRGM